MHRIRLLTLGLMLAACVGILLSQYWNFILGIVVAGVVGVIFVVAAFLRSGPGWTHDEDDDRHRW